MFPGITVEQPFMFWDFTSLAMECLNRLRPVMHVLETREHFEEEWGWIKQLVEMDYATAYRCIQGVPQCNQDLFLKQLGKAEHLADRMLGLG